MKNAYLLIMLVSIGLLTSCDEKASEPAMTKRITGSWLVTSEKMKLGNNSLIEDENGISTDTWGFGYITSIRLNSDSTFDINFDLGEHPVSGVVIPPNTWMLSDNETKVTFYSAIEYVGLILRDTSQFQVSIDDENRLILENDKVLLKHKRMD